MVGVNFMLHYNDLFDTIKLKQFENLIIDSYQYLNASLYVTIEKSTSFNSKINSKNYKFGSFDVSCWFRKLILIIFQTIENWLEFDEQTLD